MYKYTCSKNQGHVKFCKYISRSSGFCKSTMNDVKIPFIHVHKEVLSTCKSTKKHILYIP